MRILALADEESKYLWDYFEKSKLEGIDLIISCGDLDPRYLSFLTTFTNAPVLYVHGNHDGIYDDVPPDGCICIDEKIYVHNGVRILGLGGSMRYRDGKHQYTEFEMKLRCLKMQLSIFRHGGFDILVTHAPARHLNDSDDLAHQGFEVFNKLLNKYHPKYFLHGHVHMKYGRKHKRFDQVGDTTVINAFERCVFEFNDAKISEN